VALVGASVVFHLLIYLLNHSDADKLTRNVDFLPLR